MAILKHFAVKNADYGAVIDYLKYQHDEFHLVPILDENGNSMLRDEFYFDGLNCNPEAFDLECELLNQQYHKNQRYDEIKCHHYIISHDPMDVADHGLTGEQAQAIGMEYAEANFPGHQALAYIQEHGYDTQKKLQDTTDTIQSKMAKARSDAKLTEAKLKKVNEQIHYLGQYLSTKSVYADFLKSTNKKDFRQNHADEIAKYEEALQFLKQNSPDGKLPTMKDLRSEKELLVQQKSAQYETYQYFRDYHRELQTVCENVNHILDASQTKQQEQKKSHQSEHSI